MVFKFIIRQHDDSPGAPPAEERVLHEQIITIGSDPSATLSFAGVAPEQALIIVEEEAPLLINRAAGTTLNGETLAREIRRPLAHGDLLGIGDRRITLDFGSAPGSNGAHAPLSPFSSADDSLPPAASPRAGASRTFASILNELRTEEDSFYFRVDSGAQAGARLVIDATETIVGWEAAGANLTADAGAVATEGLIVRKDWTGVIVEACGGAAAVRINDATLDAPRRLRDGDRLSLKPPADRNAEAATLVFHEPASLVVLETMLPQKFPPPVVAATGAQPAPDVSIDAARLPAAKRSPIVELRTRYLGYFTSAELLIMVVATLAAAVLIFLVLEYS